MHIRWLVIAVGVLAGCGVGKPSQSELEKILLQQAPSFSLLIEKIEKYRIENGRYPDDMPAAGIESPILVGLPENLKMFHSNPAHYEVARDRSFFRVTYGVNDPEDYDLYASSSYLSFEKEWKVGHYGERFPHVEAKYFGAQYQQSHSYNSLELAIFSLLEAAKSNSAYPCRNFWGDWVDKSLGIGALQSSSLPRVPVEGEVRIYAASDKKKSYAMAIDRKLFLNTKKPLPFVTGVYRLNKGGKKWMLVQQCDSSS
jgi:hypothetical protein